MTSVERPKVTVPVATGAILASIFIAWIGYKIGTERGSYASVPDALRDPYVQGTMEGSFLIPCVVAIIAYAFKGRSTRRVLIVYTVVAILSGLATAATLR